jgi:hypothetical protein
MSESQVAKTQLREHLSTLLIPTISEGFWSIQTAASELCERNGTPDQVIRTFQNMLTKIPEWSDVTITTEVDRIKKTTRCSYLDDLMMGVFISYMKAFASLHHSEGTEISIDFDRPSLAKFIHECYVQSARKLWQVAYLFKTTGVSSETQARCRQEIETIINQSLEHVIRSFLPWESITRKYFGSSAPASAPVVEDSDSEEEEEEKKKAVSFESDDEDDEEAPPPLTITEETTTLDVIDIGEEEDPLKELEKKAQETLVLNL